MQIKATNPKYVAIRALPVEKNEDDVLERTEQSRESVNKKQNRGHVVSIGSKCDSWIGEGDLVSFYRAAAAPVPVGDEELLLVHEDHILVKFEEI